MKTLLVLALCASWATAAVLDAAAAGTPPKLPAVTNKPPAARSLPFTGKLTAVDRAKRTITVGSRLFYLTSETRLTRAGQPATLDDGVIGEETAGAYRKRPDGTRQAVSVRFGPKVPGPKTVPDRPGKPKPGTP